MNINYWQILQLKENASLKEIKKAYFRLAKLYHPDVNKNHSEQFKLINEAYHYLINLKTAKNEDLTDYFTFQKHKNTTLVAKHFNNEVMYFKYDTFYLTNALTLFYQDVVYTNFRHEYFIYKKTKIGKIMLAINNKDIDITPTISNEYIIALTASLFVDNETILNSLKMYNDLNYLKVRNQYWNIEQLNVTINYEADILDFYFNKTITLNYDILVNNKISHKQVKVMLDLIYLNKELILSNSGHLAFSKIGNLIIHFQAKDNEYIKLENKQLVQYLKIDFLSIMFGLDTEFTCFNQQKIHLTIPAHCLNHSVIKTIKDEKLTKWNNSMLILKVEWVDNVNIDWLKNTYNEYQDELKSNFLATNIFFRRN